MPSIRQKLTQRISTIAVLCSALAWLTPVCASAQTSSVPANTSPTSPTHELIYIWPNGAPGSEGQTAPEQIEAPTRARDYSRITSIHKPSLTVYLPPKDNANGAAVIVCPGGGHSFLAMDIEGDNVADWLARHGIAAFVLRYRLARETNSPYKVEIHALADAQRAIRTVRSRAAEWNLNPNHIGIMGFSAGGQLAALAASRAAIPTGGAPEPVDQVDCRPDFQALIYPAIPRNMTLDKQLTPPAFLACGANDSTNISVGLPNLFVAMKTVGIPAELHIYTGVGHGFGIRPAVHTPVAGWTDRFAEWLAYSGFEKKP